jgi:hypothetical protein
MQGYLYIDTKYIPAERTISIYLLPNQDKWLYKILLVVKLQNHWLIISFTLKIAINKWWGKLSKIPSLDVDADDIIRKETYRFYAFNVISLSLDLNKTALKQGDQYLSNHHLSNKSNHYYYTNYGFY